MLTQARLHELLSYDVDTGMFTWIKSTSNRVKVGVVAGCKHRYGYLLIRIDQKLYKCHRLAWLYTYGTWPKNQLDHINGIRDDNRIVNLREANHRENAQNCSIRAHNTSGFPGVSWDKQHCKWRAQIRHNKRQIYLGLFDTPEEAHAIYLQAKHRLHTFQPTPRTSNRYRRTA